jgi:hypothetical protein
MPNENIELIRDELIGLYLEIKIRKSDEVKKNIIIIGKIFIDRLVG